MDDRGNPQKAARVKYNAVITAGGRVDGEFASVLGTAVKALAPFRGSSFLQIAIDALRGAGVESIAVVGGPEVRAACTRSSVRMIDESLDGAENLRRALHAWDDATPLLYLTSDMPFLTAAALEQFLSHVPDDTLALPLTEWPAFCVRFPGAPPFGTVLAGEKVVNGGAFVIPAYGQKRVEHFAMRFFDARKSLWRMAVLTGPTVLLQFALRRLSVARLESHAQRLLGLRAAAIRHAPPELAYDVDVLAEYRYAISQS